MSDSHKNDLWIYIYIFQTDMCYPKFMISATPLFFYVVIFPFVLIVKVLVLPLKRLTFRTSFDLLASLVIYLTSLPVIKSNS